MTKLTFIELGKGSVHPPKMVTSLRGTQEFSLPRLSSSPYGVHGYFGYQTLKKVTTVTKLTFIELGNPLKLVTSFRGASTI